jgi:hypothetical protein
MPANLGSSHTTRVTDSQAICSEFATAADWEECRVIVVGLAITEHVVLGILAQYKQIETLYKFKCSVSMKKIKSSQEIELRDHLSASET